MLHENFEALVANIANQINQLDPSELPTLVVTNDNVSIYAKGGVATKVIRGLLTKQPGHTHDVEFNQELQDAFEHNNMRYVKVGNTIAHGLLRTSIVNNEPAVFWLDVFTGGRQKVMAEQAQAIVADLKKNADYPGAFNIQEMDINTSAMNWEQLRGFLLGHADVKTRFRLASITEHDLVLSDKAIRYYTDCRSYYPMDPVAYHEGINLFDAYNFVGTHTRWSVAPTDSNRPVVEVFV